MKTNNGFAVGLAMLVLAARLVAVEWPVRERIENQGWTIGFTPADRTVAETVAKKIPDLEKRLTAINAVKTDFGAEAFAARAGELARKAAAAGAWPGGEADFRREFERAAAIVREVETALHAALDLHAIEIWRTMEVRERMKSGEPLPGFKWDAKENRPTVNFAFNWNVSAETFQLTKTIDMPPAIFLRLEKLDDPAAEARAAKDLENWAAIVEQMSGSMQPLAVRMSGSVAIGRVFKAALANEPATTWVREGLTGYVWRDVVRHSVAAKSAGNYAVMVAQIPVAKTGDKPFDLEVWSEPETELYQILARQVFINIAETDGPAALAKVLGAFWQLPIEQRTSANLRRLYRAQMNTGIEARAPRRSLGMPAK